MTHMPESHKPWHFSTQLQDAMQLEHFGCGLGHVNWYACLSMPAYLHAKSLLSFLLLVPSMTGPNGCYSDPFFNTGAYMLTICY
jgi:hypothetical protein